MLEVWLITLLRLQQKKKKQQKTKQLEVETFKWEMPEPHCRKGLNQRGGQGGLGAFFTAERWWPPVRNGKQSEASQAVIFPSLQASIRPNFSQFTVF